MGYTPCLCNIHIFRCQCHWTSIQPLVIKKSAVKLKVLFHFPWTILSSCSWSSIYGSQVARALCLWVSIYTSFLEEGSDVHLRAQFLSPFHWFFSWYKMIMFSFFSCNPRLNELSTPMSKWYSDRVHLLIPLPVPFVFYIFVNGDEKLIALWQTRHFFKNCSGLLRCISKHGA